MTPPRKKTHRLSCASTLKVSHHKPRPPLVINRRNPRREDLREDRALGRWTDWTSAYDQMNDPWERD